MQRILPYHHDKSSKQSDISDFRRRSWLTSKAVDALPPEFKIAVRE